MGMDGLTFEVSRHWYSTKVVVGYIIPTGDTWNPRQKVTQTFLYDGLLLYNSIKDEYEFQEKQKEREDEVKRNQYLKREQELKDKVLADLIQNAQKKNDSSNS
jgi:hypothetical protein